MAGDCTSSSTSRTSRSLILRSLILFLIQLQLSFVVHASDISTIPIPFSGNASLTHYDLPLANYVASCGCGGNSSFYPTAAISQAVYGSTISAGPACGQCFNLTLIQSFAAIPVFVLPLASRPSIVVKITDKCPAPALESASSTWCGATSSQPNKAGLFVHFDLSYPSPAIPLGSFYPPVPLSYGFDDFGGWIINFERVSCQFWAGYQNNTASIVDPSLIGIGNTGCCPIDPFINNSTMCNTTSLKIGAASSISVHYTSTTTLIFIIALIVSY